MEFLLDDAIATSSVTEQLVRNLIENHRVIYEFNFNDILYAVIEQKDVEIVDLLFTFPCGTKDRVAIQAFRFAAYAENDYMVNWITAWFDEQQEINVQREEIYVCGLFSPSNIAYLWVKNRAEDLAEHAAAFLADQRNFNFLLPAVKRREVVERFRDLGLGAELLQMVIPSKWIRTIKMFADEPELVRKACLADGGVALHRVWKKKSVVRVLLRMGVSRSDCSSVGLLWTDMGSCFAID